MGEHSVVYGRPALVAAVALRLEVRLRPAPSGSGISLHLPDVDHRERTGWAAVMAYADRARRRWETYASAPRAAAFAGLRGGEAGHLVKVALGEAARHLGERDGPPLDLAVRSEIPIGSGFGSSAALAVATLAAYLALRGRYPEPAVLERLALEVERRQHGLPSGVDAAAVLHGGLVWAEPARDVGTDRGDDGAARGDAEEAGGDDGAARGDDGAASGDAGAAGLDARPLHARPLREGDPRRHLDRFRIFDTGTPAEPTGAVVAAVRERVDREPNRFEEVLDAMGRTTREFRDAVLDPDAPGERIAAAVRDFEAGLEALGVVPERVRALVRRVEERGGAAKISGAGALSSPAAGPPGAGCLLVHPPRRGGLGAWTFLRGLRRVRVRVGVEGLRLEDAA